MAPYFPQVTLTQKGNSFFSREFEDSPDEVTADGEMDLVRQCTLSIEGMTCGSCVNKIQTEMTSKPGVLTAKVDLDSKIGRFEFDPQVTVPDLIREFVDDLGFKASFEVPDLNPEVKEDRTVFVEVIGMTCQSCVRNIKGKIGERKGVHSVQVCLKEMLAEVEVEVRAKVTTAEIAEAIEQVNSKKFKARALESAEIGIQGMTCQSCVRKIEGTLTQLNGVKRMKVDLENKRGHAVFDPEVTSAETLAVAINNISPKFTALVDATSTRSSPSKRPPRTRRDHSDNEDEDEEGQTRGRGGHRTVEVDLQKFVLRVQGMTCASCVASIEKHGMKIRGELLYKIILACARGGKNQIIFLFCWS